MRHICPSSRLALLTLLLLLALLTGACGYLDQELHLGEEDYMATFDATNEGIGLSSTGYSSGCGGGHRYTLRKGKRVRASAHLVEQAQQEERSTPTSASIYLEETEEALLTARPLLEEEATRREDQPSLALNHALITQIATQHAH